MDDKINILSTKTLNLEQISLLEQSKFNLISTDFIKIKAIEIDLKKLLTSPKNWIVTSQNSTEILLNNFSIEDLKEIKFYCIGQKTAQVIKDNNLNLVDYKSYSKDLGELILSEYNTKTFTLFAGTSRRDELPNLLSKNNITLTEVTIYDTLFCELEVEEKLDGILFFSPSGIKSYLGKNTITTEHLFCIGSTTATEAKKYSKNISIAAEQTIEAVLKLTKQHYA